MEQYKIWWQSSTKDGGFPEYKEAVEAHARKFLSPEFTVEMHGVPYGFNELGWLSVKCMNAHEILHNVLKASDAGYDAVVFGCFQDPTLLESRELVDIPVLGMGETSLLFSNYYGRKPAILDYDPLFSSKYLHILLHSYGMQNKVVTIPPFKMSLDALGRAFEEPDEVIELSLKAAQEAVRLGADVIIPGCGLLNLILANNGVNRVPGTSVPIMDVTAILMKAAEAVIILKEEAGLSISRQGFYARPSDETIAKIRKVYYND